eukprot:754957-Hanusia_phi.AAC.1
MLGKSLSGISTRRSEEINNIRAIGKDPTPEDLRWSKLSRAVTNILCLRRSVVLSVSSKFDKMEVVLVPRLRGGFAYGYVVESDGNHHYLVRKTSTLPSSSSDHNVRIKHQQSDPMGRMEISVLSREPQQGNIRNHDSKDRDLSQQHVALSTHNEVHSTSYESPTISDQQGERRDGMLVCTDKTMFDELANVSYRARSCVHICCFAMMFSTDSEREWLENFLRSEEGKLWLETAEGQNWKTTAE